MLIRFKATNLRRADPIQFDPRPGYVYRWFTAHSQHISAMGADGYERLGRQPFTERSARLTRCMRLMRSMRSVERLILS